jgi:hypothetical protein
MVYQMRIRAKYTPRTPMESFSYFRVIVLHHCFIAKITPSYIPEEIIFEMSHKPLPSAETMKFGDWHESVGVCKPFTYKASMASGNSLPSFI